MKYERLDDNINNIYILNNGIEIPSIGMVQGLFWNLSLEI